MLLCAQPLYSQPSCCGHLGITDTPLLRGGAVEVLAKKKRLKMTPTIMESLHYGH